MGRFWSMLMRQRWLAKGFRSARGMQASGIPSRWQTNAHEDATYGIRTRSWDSARRPLSVVCSVILERASSRSYGAQKNTLRCLWQAAFSLVRSQDASGPRLVVRRHAGLSRVRDPARRVPTLRQGEARPAGFPRRQSVLYQALCVVGRSALCRCAAQVGRRRAAP